jgi:hypothetical protein
MVIPLAISPSGDLAAVWWWPERRGVAEVGCRQGIYVVSTTGAGSRLVASGDWRVSEDEDSTWSDPTDHRSSSLRFRLPKASFSPVGDHLAIVDGDVIDVYMGAFLDHPLHHVGACPQWAWAAAEARFVAGCEDMTSAWMVEGVCCDGGLGARSLPIPAPPLPDDFFDGWEQASGRAIGFTDEGDLRITRIYGFGTGCEGSPCNIPSPAWAVTTIDRETHKAVHAVHETDILFDGEARLSADASWLYGVFYGALDAVGMTIEIDTGVIRTVPLLGNVSGAAPDGSTMFGWVDDESPNMVVHALTPRSMTDLATIRWPSPAVTHTNWIPVIGLWVAAPA